MNLRALGGDDPVNGRHRRHPAGVGTLPWEAHRRHTRRDVFRWSPAVAFTAIGAGSDWISAFKAMGSVALGSVVAAGIERAVTGASFGDVFQRDFGVSSLGIVASAILGGGVKAAGSNRWLNGYVEVNHPPFGLAALEGGLTLGSATVFSGVAPDDLVPHAASITYAQHEFGHTLQFLGLSVLCGGPWATYLGLGLLGMAGQWGKFSPGCQWEVLAEDLSAPGEG